ncbi:MAG: hypothetical protein MMC33_006663 [Icmadophila ericetorum]|nr:hypothetical protein [Icmadophila ericetorum]
MSTPTFPPTSHRTVSANQDPMTPQVRKWFYETFFSQQEQASWTNEVLPAIIGMLDPPPGWEREPIPEYVPGRNGEPVVAANGIKVRNLVHLPNVLQNYQEIRGWTVEAYFRGHRDFQYHDIRVRQPNGGTDYHNSAMSNKRTRHCRKLYPMRSWVLKAHGVTRTLVELVDSLTQAQIQQNTTWIVLPQGIQQPGNPNRILALDHFLHDRQPHQPSERLRGALTEWTRLRALAVEHNKTNWRALPSHLLPGYSRVKGTGVRAKMAQAKVVVSPQTSTEPLATPLPSRTSASITARSGKGKNNEEDYRDTGFFDEGFYGEDDEEEEYAWSEDVGGDTGGEESFDAGSVAHGHVYSKLGFEKLLGNLPQEEHDIDTVLAAQLDVANPHHSAGNHDSVCMTKESDVPQELLAS